MSKVIETNNRCISCKNYIPIGYSKRGLCLNTRKKVFSTNSCKDYIERVKDGSKKKVS